MWHPCTPSSPPTSTSNITHIHRNASGTHLNHTSTTHTSSIKTYAQDMVSTLLSMLSDPRPLVRSITCWALSRYSHWIVTRAQADASAPANGAAGGAGQFEAVLQALLAHVTDRNRKVQEAACSALATLEEAAGGHMVPYVKVWFGGVLVWICVFFVVYFGTYTCVFCRFCVCVQCVVLMTMANTTSRGPGPHTASPTTHHCLPAHCHHPQPILTTLGAALNVYSRRNLRILYDALSTLAEAAAPALQTPEGRALLMPPLMAKWTALTDDDKELLPLLECFTAVAQALGTLLLPCGRTTDGVVLCWLMPV